MIVSHYRPITLDNLYALSSSGVIDPAKFSYIVTSRTYTHDNLKNEAIKHQLSVDTGYHNTIFNRLCLAVRNAFSRICFGLVIDHQSLIFIKKAVHVMGPSHIEDEYLPALVSTRQLAYQLETQVVRNILTTQSKERHMWNTDRIRYQYC